MYMIMGRCMNSLTVKASILTKLTGGDDDTDNDYDDDDDNRICTAMMR